MDFEVFCDESRSDIFTSKSSPFQYMVIGSLWCESKNKKIFKQEIQAIREKYKYFSEFKWNKVSPSKVEFYLALIEFFFAKEETLRFRSIVVEKDKVDLIKYHNSDAELSFYKFYYQLLHHWIVDCNVYSIFVDIKTNRSGNRIATLKRYLQNANISTEIKNVQALPSDEVVFIQLADLLTGAISAKFNIKTINSEAKKAIIQKIEELSGHEISPTLRNANKLNIFKINPLGGW